MYLSPLQTALDDRYLTKDPIGFAGGDTNLYRYTYNDPVNLTDPTGKIVPVIVLTYIAFEVGFFTGATYNRVIEDVSYSETYTDANPLVNLADHVLPTTSLFSDTKTYEVFEDAVKKQRIKDIDALIENNFLNGKSCE